MTATLLSNAKQQFLDTNGKPLSGGSVYFYIPNTSTFKNTWQDEGETILNTNPVILDSNGQAIIFGDGQYRQVVFDVHGNLIWDKLTDSFALNSQFQTFSTNIQSSSGSSYVGFIQSGAGTIARTLQDKNREFVSVTDFSGCDTTGGTDSTTAFNAALTYVSSIGGGIVHVPFGIYKLTDFVIDHESVVFQGETSGYGYSTTSGSVQLVPSSTANFVVRFKGARTGVVINAAAYSGLRNLQVMFTTGTCDYGVFIDSGATIMENVIVQGFNYNCMCADQMNANIFRNVAFVAAVYVNFSVCEAAANSYINPNITSITSVSNTTWTMDNCLFRQSQGFGVVIRSGANVAFRGCGFESNAQAGLYMYRPDSSTLRMIQYENCWFENNYSNYISGSTSYSITGNRMFLIGNSSTYIAWTSAYQAGYQILSDSQTHSGGGGDTFEFCECAINADTSSQKAVFILSGFKYDFRKVWFGGTGDTANLVKVTVDAEAVHWHDPVAGNSPYALVTSITNAFGANAGSRAAYFKSGTSFGTAELGGIYPELGIFGGPIHFRDLDPTDPRRADIRCLDDYHEQDAFTIPWRTGSAFPFTISGEVNTATKIGREIIIKCKGVLTVSSTTASQDTFFCDANLPFQAGAAGNLIGSVIIEPTGGGATVVNNGWSPMKMNAIASAISVFNVFPVLSIGMTFNYEVTFSYASAT